MTTPIERPQFLLHLGAELARVAQAEAARLDGTRRRRLPVLRPLRLRGALLALAATLVVAAGAGAATGIVPLPGGGPSFVAPQTQGQFAPALVEHVSALGREPTADDTMGAAGSYVSGPDAPAPASALRITPPPIAPATPHVTTATLPAWVVPTASGAASLQMLPPGADGPASGVAADLAMVEQGHAWMTVDRTLVGLAPDGVERVVVTLASGTRVELQVAHNSFGGQLDASVQGIEFGVP